MQFQCTTQTFTVSSIYCNPKLPLQSPSSVTLRKPRKPPFPSLRRNCAAPNQELVFDVNGSFSPQATAEEVIGLVDGGESQTKDGLVSAVEVETEEKVKIEDQSIWGQMKEIVMFTGPAAGLWLCGPLMSLIDTAVIGQGSSLELAALGPATVLCDNLCYTFMFLSVSTSNLVATSLARRDKDEVQHQISILLFIGLSCGVVMMVFTRLFGILALKAFTGAKNSEIVPAANRYVQIRGFAWPAVLVGWVAQSASLGMKDSWGPLKALAVASVINGVGDVVLCTFLGYGIAGAAWATMVSQIVAAYMMMDALKKKGYNAFSLCVPSSSELSTIFGIAAPVFVTMMSKVMFYTLLVYFATSMGTSIIAAHQARMLLKSLGIIGATLGVVVGIIGTAVPWLFPGIFTHDKVVISQMHKVIVPYFLALSITASTHSLEGTLLAGRDLRYISLTMTGCFVVAGFVLMARFSLALVRLLSKDGVLYSEDTQQRK
ncbi:unnamed protein product [Cochlearia groenlandica]